MQLCPLGALLITRLNSGAEGLAPCGTPPSKGNELPVVLPKRIRAVRPSRKLERALQRTDGMGGSVFARWCLIIRWSKRSNALFMSLRTSDSLTGYGPACSRAMFS